MEPPICAAVATFGDGYLAALSMCLLLRGLRRRSSIFLSAGNVDPFVRIISPASVNDAMAAWDAARTVLGAYGDIQYATFTALPLVHWYQQSTQNAILPSIPALVPAFARPLNEVTPITPANHRHVPHPSINHVRPILRSPAHIVLALHGEHLMAIVAAVLGSAGHGTVHIPGWP
jgi:hypothetical protein